MEKKIGFIGCGNMGEAMLLAALKGHFATPKEMIIHTKSEERRRYLQKKYQVSVASNNEEVARQSQLIVLGVKPNLYEQVIEEINLTLKKDQILLGISPSFTLDRLSALCRESAQVVRAMPNTPAMVGCGMTGVCFKENTIEVTKKVVKNFLGCCGEVVEVPENLMKAVGSVSGSSPAFVYMVIEAMAQGAILLGLKKEDAYVLAAKAVEGSAKMVLETGKHPAELRDAVCSAGGTTIEGVASLEQNGLKSSLIEAMRQTAYKFEKMEEIASQ